MKSLRDQQHSRGTRPARERGVRTRGGQAEAAATRPTGDAGAGGAVDQLVMDNTEDWCVRQPLETPLHTFKARTWHPCPEPEPVPGSLSHSRPRKRPKKKDDVTDYFHYGSEGEDDDEEEDEKLVADLYPRMTEGVSETPLDPEEEPAPADSVSADADPMVTDQPWGLYDFDWKPFPDAPILPESRREKFSNINVGPAVPCVDPYEIFVSIWDRQFMEYIASETNRYAQQVAAQMFERGDLHPGSRIGGWHPTTADELYVFFAVLLSMGIVVKAGIDEYWNTTSDMFYTPGFRLHMSLKRFQILSKCLHFQNNEDMCRLKLDASEAKLFKILPVLSHLNNRFQSMYRPKQNIALDESLLQWKGLLDINQIIPDKAATMGMKTYEICESQTGYLWRFKVHAHSQRSSPHQPEDRLNASTPATVLRLIHGLEGQGYTLWMDNYYNSPILARHLKSIGFDCVGTLRTNRRFVPRELHSLTKSSMRPGQIAGLTSGDVDVMVWRDANRVAMISTYHGNATTEIQGSIKPTLIVDYNIMMGGVDKKDQMLSMYPIERNRSKVWYKKLFRRLINVSVLNSYIIYRESLGTSSSLSHRKFRKSLINSILQKHSLIPPRVATPTNVERPKFRIDVTHRIEEYPFSVKQHQRLRRKCVTCKKPVQTFCFGCNKTVCIGRCNIALHSS